MEIDILKKRIIDLIGEERLNQNAPDKVEAAINLGMKQDNLLARILGTFVYIRFGENEARRHWEKILSLHDRVSEQLEEPFSILSSVYDYFLNQTDLLKNPLVIDHEVFHLVKRYAVVDSLSGVFNRNYFELVFKKELKRAIRYDKTFSLLLVDIDDFKRVNDEHGHVFGDSVIRHCAGVLKAVCREEDILCRFGGEEFIFFLPETPAAGALQFGERVRQRISGDRFLNQNRISISGGIAEYPHDARSALDLLRCADSALYKAKAEGKDRISLFENNRRRHPRFEKAFPVLFKPLDFVFSDGANRKLVTDDISLSGLRCVLSDVMLPDTELVLAFGEKSDVDSRVVTLGKIVWSKKIDGDRYMYGVQFQSMEHRQLEKMMKLISE